MPAALTIATVKRFHRSPATLRAIAAVKVARAEAARISAHVASYIEPAFLALEPFYSDDGEVIKQSDDLFMVDGCEERIAAWYALCDTLHAANGYKLEPGFCPALVAQNVARKAEQAVLDLLGTLVGCNGNDFNRTLEMRAKALELVLDPPTK